MTETELEIERRYALRPIRWREICKMSDEELLRELKHNDSGECEYGIRWRKYSWWIGAHYSPKDRRWCINLIPCLTIRIVLPGGYHP